MILNPGSDDAKYVSIDTGEDYDDIAEKDDEDLEPAEGGGSDQEVPLIYRWVPWESSDYYYFD